MCKSRPKRCILFLYSVFSLLITSSFSPDKAHYFLCLHAFILILKLVYIHIWLLVPHLIHTSVCPTKTQSLPKVFHPVDLDHSSSPLLCILIIFLLLARFPSPGLHELLIPELHLSKRKMCTQLLCCSPLCLSSCRADGKCRISPFPPPASSFLSCSSPVQFWKKYLTERTFFGRGGEQTQVISLCACSRVCLFLRAGAQPLKLDFLGSQQRDSFWKGKQWTDIRFPYLSGTVLHLLDTTCDLQLHLSALPQFFYQPSVHV